jgi:hypothetical protein
LPKTLGVVNWPFRQPLLACEWANGKPYVPSSDPSALACEAVEGLSHSPDGCLGNAPPGWFFVLDTEFAKQKIVGGCTGQCGTEPTGSGPRAPLPAGDTHG